SPPDNPPEGSPCLPRTAFARYIKALRWSRLFVLCLFFGFYHIRAESVNGFCAGFVPENVKNRSMVAQTA
ncbi:MAG: hypothetical protein IKX84_10135, partial [Clostridia bacterium]|nr:hypothetical protein [Clostridia bacterium]